MTRHQFFSRVSAICEYGVLMAAFFLFLWLSSEIDLLSEKFIDGFATQGLSSYSNWCWVSGYVVHYSLNGFSWDVISADERERVSGFILY